MKILYDHQTFTWQEFGGISRYYTELIKNIPKFDTFEPILPNIFSNNSNLDAFQIKHRHFFKNIQFKGKVPIMDKFNKMKIRAFLKSGKFDVFHPTYYDPYFLNYLDKRPFVITVYDMIHEIYPQHFTNSEVLIKNKRELIEKSQKIIAISENTKKDLIKFCQIEKEKIEVIYLANPLKPNANKNINLKLPAEYLLFVGNRDFYKNFNFFIEGVSELILNNQNLFVICAGGGIFSEVEIKKFKILNIEDKVQYFPITDENLFNLYKNAKLFVFPSLYEGFGLPILEAFYSGCPVILSNRSSLPEIARDAAIYFDPEKVASMIDKIEETLNNEELRQNLQEKGYEILKNYSWEKTVKSTLNLYGEILCL
jgi:glycosyltransferase involved in cell wall biosynthesis